MSAENGFGIIVPIEDLKARLRTISSGPCQWRVKLAVVESGEECSTAVCAEISYTNPTLADMPNEICWRFPVLQELCWRGLESFVCLHPSVAVPVQEGLYFEGARLLCDPLEDFYSFWPLIREVLS